METHGAPTAPREPPDQGDRTRAWQEFQHNVSVVAGAGTGKTRVLVDRYLAWVLVEAWRRIPDCTPAAAVTSILAITFTEKAAGEMQERVTRSLELVSGGSPDHKDAPYLRRLTAALAAHFHVSELLLRARADAVLGQTHRMEISTIHAFAARVLSRFPIEAGLHPAFRVDASGAELRRVVRADVIRAVQEALLDADEARSAAVARLLGDFGERCFVDLALALLPLDDYALTPPPAPGELLAAAGVVIRGLLRVSSQLPSLSALKTRRIAAGLNTLSSTLGPDGLDAAGRDVARAVRRDLAEPLSKTVQERLGSERHAVEQARQALLPWLDELVEADLAAVRAVLELLAPAVARSKATIHAKGLLSFDDLLAGAERLLVGQPAVAAQLAARYRQLLVDEFQDTDPRQCRILAAIDRAGGGGSLFVVGDPKQSIYAFRGADLAAYESFTADFPVQLTLSTSFRSAPPLVRAVNQAFDRLFEPAPGLQPAAGPLIPFRTDAPEGPPVAVWDTVEGDEDQTAAVARDVESEAIARAIKAMAGGSRGGGRRWSRFAVLSRVQSEAARVVESLEALGIPCVVSGDKEFYRRQEVLDATNLLRVLVDPSDALAWVGLLRCPIGGVVDRALLALSSARFFDGMGRQAAVAEALRRAREAEPELADDLARVGRLDLTLEALRERFYDGAIDEALEALQEELPIPEVYAAEYLGERKVANFQRVVQSFADVASAGVVPLREWLDDVATRLVGRDDESESAIADETTDAVRVMSVHASKGLEFDVVFVPRLDWSRGGAQGSTLALEGDGGLVVRLVGHGRRAASFGLGALEQRAEAVEAAEALRLFYVACTRAKDALVLAGQLQKDAAFCSFVKRGFPEAEVASARQVYGGEADKPDLEPLDVEPWLAPVLDAERRMSALAQGIRARRLIRSATSDARDADEGGHAAPPAPDLFRPRQPDGEAGGTTLGTEVHALLDGWEGGPVDLRAASPAAASLVRALVASPLAERVRTARQRHAELPFVRAAADDATEIGAVDLLLETDAGWLIVDYKTNKVSSLAAARAVAEQYRGQATLYRRAVAEALGVPVAVELWFLRGLHVVPMD